MTTLFLHEGEREAFDRLPDVLKEGWSVSDERLTYDDSPPRQMMRLSLLRLHDPRLLNLRNKAQTCSSFEQIAALIGGMDLKDIDEDDLAALFFGLGPAVIDELILEQLRDARRDTDIEGVAALSLIRHSILNAFHPVA